MADPARTSEPLNAIASPATPIPNGTPATMDVEMTDAGAPPAETVPASQPHPIPEPTTTLSTPLTSAPTHPSSSAAAPTPVPAATTPSRNSPHPPSIQPSVPTYASPHGSSTRVYLNQNVTPYLLEGMKHLVTSEPEKPLKWLSEYLAMRSLEIEGP
ncbi:hypothetical protein P154DRAFT_622329 [Amniculicola lignicola CBS 123094]|uniref:Uncharacterized protein n=1 Tax=Amniculicola lignicola CBS 123094 TaxID=1392246 RepID=A0A6A5W774_9PLEO|nr:hypothetical protein P154DRAFT_622329 [Amniculicola lignicola CBS 123094]